MKSKEKLQSGFVMISALIFLVVLTILSIYVMRSSIFEEKMAGNQRDLLFAQEAAEMALRDAELDIRGLRFDNVYCAASAIAVATCGGAKRIAGTRPTAAADAGNFWVVSNFAIDDTYTMTLNADNRPASVDNTNFGVYSGSLARDTCGKSLWLAADWDLDTPSDTYRCSDTAKSIIRTVVYGSFTGAPKGTDIFPTGVRLPRYLIEQFTAKEMGVKDSKKIFFRITAVGFGRVQRENGTFASVTLQSVFSPL